MGGTCEKRAEHRICEAARGFDEKRKTQPPRTGVVYETLRGRIMKNKVFIVFLLTLIVPGTVILSQTEQVAPLKIIVSDFTSRAKDVSADEAITLTEMLISGLAANVQVVMRDALIRTMDTLKFKASDWSDSAKTKSLGVALSAQYFASGAITQLGPSITLNIHIRDIESLNVVATLQRQYTIENVWDNDNGMPGIFIAHGHTLNYIVRRVREVHTTRQQELAAQRKAQERDALLPRIIVGVWGGDVAGGRANHLNYLGQSPQPPFNADYLAWGNFARWTFAADGKFEVNAFWISRWGNDGLHHHDVIYAGTYTLEGNALKLSWESSRGTKNLWKYVQTGGSVGLVRDNRRHGWRDQGPHSGTGGTFPSTPSGNSTYTIDYSEARERSRESINLRYQSGVLMELGGHSRSSGGPRIR
jgi:hypothetical protein